MSAGKSMTTDLPMPSGMNLVPVSAAPTWIGGAGGGTGGSAARAAATQPAAAISTSETMRMRRSFTITRPLLAVMAWSWRRRAIARTERHENAKRARQISTQRDAQLAYASL